MQEHLSSCQTNYPTTAPNDLGPVAHRGSKASKMPHSPQAPALAHPYLALAGLYVGGFTGMYSETALNIALPQLSSTFGISEAFTQWFVVGYMLVIGIVLPFASILMKWFRARSLTLFALGAFFTGSLISAFAPGFEIALIGRSIQGIGTGIYYL